MRAKITADHLERTALVYVRQSTPGQVRGHVESQRRQYALADVARELGFHRVETSDDDLGISGSGFAERPGFQRLLTTGGSGAAGAVLADWGADVIKIEHPVTGDGQRGLAAMGMKSTEGNVDFMMQQSNRGKRSVGLDIANPAGLELLYKLAEQCDVFLTNFLPDARERLKIDVEHIRARNPNIVYVRGSGQGPKGPDAGKGG